MLIVGSVLLAFGPIFVRAAGTGPVAAGFWRVFLAMPLLFLVATVRKQRIGDGGAPVIGAIVIGGLFFAADMAFWHLGLVHTKVANATLFGNSSSLILPIWGAAVLKHRMLPHQTLAVVLAIGGAGLLMGSSYELSPQNVKGDLFCILGGVLYTGYILAIQRARQTVGSWLVLAIASLAAAIPLFVASMALGETIIPQDWTMVMLLAFSSQVLGQGLIVYAIGWFSPLVVGLALLTQPVAGAVLGWLIHGETLSSIEIAGAMGIAAALVLVRLPGRA